MKVLDHADLDQLRTLTEIREPLWLDLRDPGEGDLVAIGQILGLHDLAVQNSREFGQRPKFDRYGDQLLLVFFGLHMKEDGTPCPVEVHVHISSTCVLTISRVPPAELERVRAGLTDDDQCSQGQLVYRVLRAITDSLADGLTTISDRIDAFERTIFTRPRAGDRDLMAVLRRKLDQLHRVLIVQHQVFDHAVGAIAKLAGPDEWIEPYLTDVGERLWRSLDEVDANRDTLNLMLQTYSNEIQERLTIVATIFLPLTALTGFFGMNFDWMINHIGAAGTFFGLGVGGLLASSLLIRLWLRRTGLLDSSRRRT